LDETNLDSGPASSADHVGIDAHRCFVQLWRSISAWTAWNSIGRYSVCCMSQPAP
jgi:hypothetical protein